MAGAKRRNITVAEVILKQIKKVYPNQEPKKEKKKKKIQKKRKVI